VTEVQGSSPDLTKIAPIWPLIIALAMFAAAVWAGGEIAKGEIAQQQLDSITAKGNLVRAKTKLAPGAVIGENAVEAVDTFANRVEPYCINAVTSVRGKKCKYGLEPGQILTARDLE